MLRITVNKSATGAKKYYSEKYYSEGNKHQEYYSEKDQSIGTWYGKAANQLGLTGAIKKEDFASLCDNQIPGSNTKLSSRSNSERRVGYDFTFNASKSVSLARAFGSESEKKEILNAFQDSVRETMAKIESAAQARIRKNGANNNRETGNIAYGEFVHFTSRPVNGVADPHLHAHCFAFNTTYDSEEAKWKAADFGQINKDAPYYEAMFHSTFAAKLQDLGYEVKKARTGFEIKGITRETIEKFSRRTEEIENLASEKNITDKNEKAKLGAKTRERKRQTLSEIEQTNEWEKRLSNKERQVLKTLKSVETSKEEVRRDSTVEALEYAVNHLFERRSVVSEKGILATALKHSLGQGTVGQMETTYTGAKLLSILKTEKKGLETYVTSDIALQEENDLLLNAHNTKGCFKPIHETYQPKAANLTDEQKEAVQRALTTSEGITIIAGKAGTGKTTLMREVLHGIKEAGKEIFAFAPSAEASRVVQRKEGFENATTLATLFKNKELQGKLKNSVIWVDEAGMVSNRQMNQVLEIAKQQNARVILTGDTKQHSSVERGDALRILQKDAGIVPIEVSKIQRQQNKQYKEAVFALSKSDVDKGFKKLDKMGVIHEIFDDAKRIKKIAADYVTSAHGKKNNQKVKEILVVSPTHAEGDRVTEKIREGLKQKGFIGLEDRTVRVLKNSQLTLAERQTAENYNAGQVIVFHQNAKGYKAGSKFEVAGIIENRNLLLKSSSGKLSILSPDKANCFNVFETKTIGITKGDKIRITGNGKSLEGKHLFNGMMYKIAGFDKQDNIKLSNGSLLPSDYGHLTLGYVLTSHASQGKTVDKVIISQSSMSFRASSKEQFYVSVSRGRQAVAIYTDDKKDLLRAVSQSNERESAMELTKKDKLLNKALEINRLKFVQTIREKAVQIIKQEFNKLKGYGLQRNTVAKEAGRSR